MLQGADCREVSNTLYNTIVSRDYTIHIHGSHMTDTHAPESTRLDPNFPILPGTGDPARQLVRSPLPNVQMGQSWRSSLMKKTELCPVRYGHLVGLVVVGVAGVIRCRRMNESS